MKRDLFLNIFSIIFKHNGNMFDVNYCREFNSQRSCATRESDCSHKAEECLFGFKQNAQNVRVLYDI